MSHNPRVEEVSDSDPDDMDPADFDPRNIISPADTQNFSSSSFSSQRPPRSAATAAPPLTGSRVQVTSPPGPRDIPKSWLCLYPVYFDKTRTRAEGRRVSRKLAVENPLAREIVDAVQMLGLRVGFEGDKLHPKDWANPGRVRVCMRSEDGRVLNNGIKNKHHLYILVARWLQAHPTTEESPFRLRVRGLPVPDKPLPPPPAPRGWKIGTILPIHSPAVTGGGVSENPLKEAMMEMRQYGLGGDAAGSDGGEGKKKKDKKKGKA
ncbi:hypothetical protein VTO42DRAFT_1917 [Malbranchea cinnamomea]